MSVTIRNFRGDGSYTGDFLSVCDFLIRINREKVITPHYLWARWVWQFGPYMNRTELPRIGIAEDGGQIVGLATYECEPGEAFFCVDKAYSFLKPALLDYAAGSLSQNGRLRLLLPDGDLGFQQAAVKRGYRPTAQKSVTARIDADNAAYELPDGFRVGSFADEGFDAAKYDDAIWRGFDNKRGRNETELAFMKSRQGWKAPHLDLSLRVLVTAPNGDYAAHCGMWCLPGSGYAYVEPVFTVPEYRRMGLGRAAVLEGVRRCARLGAKAAYVLSSQQFYANIGFYPYQDETWWENSAAATAV